MDIGYRKFYLDIKTWTYNETDKHILSTMVNLDHRYLLNGVEIIFGLNEYKKPPTLISPRPKILVHIDGKVLTESCDDAMNMVLMNERPERIHEALFDRKITFEYR